MITCLADIFFSCSPGGNLRGFVVAFGWGVMWANGVGQSTMVFCPGFRETTAV